MNPNLTSLIQKLKTLKPKLDRKTGGDKTALTLSTLKKRLKLPELILSRIAILLAGYPLDQFTDLELTELSKIDLRRVELTDAPQVERSVSIKHKRPLFDTGSERIFYFATDHEPTSCNSVYRPYEVIRSLLHTYKP